MIKDLNNNLSEYRSKDKLLAGIAAGALLSLVFGLWLLMHFLSFIWSTLQSFI